VHLVGISATIDVGLKPNLQILVRYAESDLQVRAVTLICRSYFSATIDVGLKPNLQVLARHADPDLR